MYSDFPSNPWISASNGSSRSRSAGSLNEVETFSVTSSRLTAAFGAEQDIQRKVTWINFVEPHCHLTAYVTVPFVTIWLLILRNRRLRHSDQTCQLRLSYPVRHPERLQYLLLCIHTSNITFVLRIVNTIVFPLDTTIVL